jgi:hypothetical protein
MDHAITQYLERIGDDCAAVLGPGMTVLGVERAELDGVVRLQFGIRCAVTYTKLSVRATPSSPHMRRCAGS